MSNIYGVAGHPIGHSLSPVIHNMLFEYYNIDAVYEKFDIAPQDFENTMDIMWKQGVKGINVTIPHKVKALETVDCLEPFALSVRSVNTIRFDGNKTYGYNTDGIGFIKALEKAGQSVENRKIAILGAGGAVNSVAKICMLKGAENVTIFARNIEKAQIVAEKVGTSCAILNEYKNYDYDIIVNATPVGMFPNTEECVIDEIKSGVFAFDLIYNPEKTSFMKLAEKCGSKAENGLWMLIYQAFEAFKIWQGINPDEIIAEKIYKRLNEVLNEK